MTPFETASGMLVYLIGSAIQGTLGFGANLFAVPILALVNPGFVPGPVLIINPILTTILTFRERGHVDGEALGWSLTGRLPGIVIGVVALNLVSEDQLGMLFGVLLLGAVALGDQFGVDDLVIGAWRIPGVIAGTLLSKPLRPRLDAGRTATAVYVLSTVAAVTLLVRSLV